MTRLSDQKGIPWEIIYRQIYSIFRAWGIRKYHSKISAEVMVETDLRGVDSHGINMFRQYDQTIRRGAINVKAEINVLRDRSTTALLDADRGLGHPVSVRAMEMAIEKALKYDVGIVCVLNSHHFGAAGFYAEMAAKAGLIGIVTTSTRGIALVPTGGTEPILGTNPLAFAAPAGKYPPVVLDFATTVAAVNKVRVKQLQDLKLPEGWVNDGNGRIITDAEEAISIFEQRTFGGFNPIGGIGETLGGHKGYGLAFFSHILGGTLPGASFSPIRVKTQGPHDPDELGHYFQAINPEAFRPINEFKQDLDKVIDILKSVVPYDPNKPVMVAGEPELKTKIQRLKNGVPINENLLSLIRDIAERAGVQYLLDNYC